MRYLALTIAINGEMPNYKEGLMRKIGDYFIEKGYFFRIVHDERSRPHGFYLFEARNEPSEESALKEFRAFLDQYKKEIKYTLIPLPDIFELLEN